ncbi:carbohydrate ABC transporter permease [Anaeromicropila herbilytica]|uniref:Sugar ABC transporter permease n=1 Tax=Anaeromicropila herbilytica TaxID=2785025 RepID=A0A7R7EMH3_9FIRM|nr:carbohydrate ABC transporter permease [Anaeromicropila herbilytica]BCN31232.1 sugar ABC transporter permease [Anaeromicropila herbilytica]
MSKETNTTAYKAKKKKITVGDISFNIINYAVFIIFTIICIYPFYYLIINTISSNDLSNNGVINFLPRKLQFENYKQVFKLSGLSAAATISLGRVVIGTLCTTLASAFLGFMFSQQKMWMRKFWYRFMCITMYFNAGLIPMYIIMLNLHLNNSFWVYILPAIVSPFNIILVKTYIESISSSLQEAAEIDGAGIVTIFVRIMLPISKPILATIAIFSAVGQWNSFQDTLIYITDQKLYSLQYLLYKYINEASTLANVMKSNGGAAGLANLATKQTATSIKMTVSVIVVFPILMVYPFAQRYFTTGIMIGSVKG